MEIIGFGVVWAGYTLGLWGYTLVKGYQGTGLLGGVPISQLIVPSKWVWPPGPTASGSGSSGPATTTSTANAQGQAGTYGKYGNRPVRLGPGTGTVGQGSGLYPHGK